MKLFLLLVLWSSLASAEKWELNYTEGSMIVYRDTSAEHLTYKAEGMVAANFYDLLSVISDTSRRPEWVKDLVESQVVEGDVAKKVVIYEQFHLPWPCDNRDSVVESVIVQNPRNVEVTVDYKETTHAKSPVRDGIVRMPYVRGTMFFRYTGEEQTYARFIMSLDVGGRLPDFIVNRFVRQAPVATVEGLLRQVKKTKGQYVDFIRLNKAPEAPY